MPACARVILALSMIVLGPTVARNVAAQPASGPVPVMQRPPQLDHRYQTGLAVMPGLGYRVIVPYDEHKDCGDSSGNASKRVCTNKVPLFLDTQLSFGATSRLDLVVDLRFGLERDPVTNNRQFSLAPGIRVWLDQDVNLKFYTTLQLLMDTTEQKQSGIPDTDFGIRNSNGLMYDVIRNVGFYLQFGESAGFRRWFRLELDLGLGVQVRFP